MIRKPYTILVGRENQSRDFLLLFFYNREIEGG